MDSLEEIKGSKVMDVRGLQYPLPLKKTMAAIRCLHPGKILEVWCSDMDLKREILQAAKGNEYRYLGFLKDPEGFTRFFIQKSG